MASTIALFVHQHVVIHMTNPAFIAPAVVISCIIVLATIFVSNKKTRKPLPPMIKDDFFKFAKEQRGPHRPQYINRCSRELNATVFRLPVPHLNPLIIVASPTLARIIMEGDKSKGIVECEKSSFYVPAQKLFDMAPSFLFSKTDTERWRQGRKGVAPAFSTANIFRQFPSIIKGVNQFHDILSKHAAEGKPVEDLAAWFNKLIFDILGSGMFQVEFKLLTGGIIYLHFYSIQFIHRSPHHSISLFLYHYLLQCRWSNRGCARFYKGIESLLSRVFQNASVWITRISMVASRWEIYTLMYFVTRFNKQFMYHFLWAFLLLTLLHPLSP